jgi:hypothetical protein
MATDPRLVGPRFGVPTLVRRWCPVHAVSALTDPKCWIAGCDEDTIPNDQWLKMEAAKQMAVFGGVRQHGGDRG